MPLPKNQQIDETFFSSGSQVVWKRGLPERYEIADGPGVLDTLEGSQKYLEGYYIMTGPSGEKYSMPPEKFRELKEDHGSGVALPKKVPKLAKLADFSGRVQTSWGEFLEYEAGKDYIIRHSKGDYGVVKAEIFKATYECQRDPSPLKSPRTDGKNSRPPSQAISW